MLEITDLDRCRPSNCHRCTVTAAEDPLAAPTQRLHRRHSGVVSLPSCTTARRRLSNDCLAGDKAVHHVTTEADAAAAAAVVVVVGGGGGGDCVAESVDWRNDADSSPADSDEVGSANCCADCRWRSEWEGMSSAVYEHITIKRH